MPKISSNGGLYDKNNKLAMTRGIESGPFIEKQFHSLNKKISIKTKIQNLIEIIRAYFNNNFFKNNVKSLISMHFKVKTMKVTKTFSSLSLASQK